MLATENNELNYMVSIQIVLTF